jgi:hypothetical protein
MAIKKTFLEEASEKKRPPVASGIKDYTTN